MSQSRRVVAAQEGHDEDEMNKAYLDCSIKGFNPDRHEALYNDAKYRSLRHEHIYSQCIPSECTFQPELIT